SLLARESAQVHHAVDASIDVSVDYDDEVEVVGVSDPGLDEEGDVVDDDRVRVRRVSVVDEGAREPLHLGVCDGVERFARVGVGEDDGAESGSVETAVISDEFIAESLGDGGEGPAAGLNDAAGEV